MPQLDRTLTRRSFLRAMGASAGADITGSLIASLPLVVLFCGLQRYWRGGATAGAIKG